jgi:hypothetical protein
MSQTLDAIPLLPDVTRLPSTYVDEMAYTGRESRVDDHTVLIRGTPGIVVPAIRPIEKIDDWSYSVRRVEVRPARHHFRRDW